jgi:hypothetical protein
MQPAGVMKRQQPASERVASARDIRLRSLRSYGDKFACRREANFALRRSPQFVHRVFCGVAFIYRQEQEEKR